MKICVIMCDDRPFDEATYTSKCFAANKAYCDTFNYDFKVFSLKSKPLPFIQGIPHITSGFGCQEHRTGKPRFVAWCKILCTYYTMKTWDYDYIVYIDTDAFLTPQNSIEKILQNNEKSELLFISCYPFKFTYINKSKYSNLDNTMEKSLLCQFKNVPCSGMYILKSSLNTLNFLKDWYLQEPNTNTRIADRPWDQAGLWDLYMQQKYDIHIMKDEGFTTRSESKKYIKFNSNFNNKSIIHCTDKSILTYDLINVFYKNVTPRDVQKTLKKFKFEALDTNDENVKTLLDYDCD